MYYVWDTEVHVRASFLIRIKFKSMSGSTQDIQNWAIMTELIVSNFDYRQNQ